MEFTDPYDTSTPAHISFGIPGSQDDTLLDASIQRTPKAGAPLSLPATPLARVNLRSRSAPASPQYNPIEASSLTGLQKRRIKRKEPPRALKLLKTGYRSASATTHNENSRHKKPKGRRPVIPALRLKDKDVIMSDRTEETEVQRNLEDDASENPTATQPPPIQEGGIEEDPTDSTIISLRLDDYDNTPQKWKIRSLWIRSPKSSITLELRKKYEKDNSIPPDHELRTNPYPHIVRDLRLEPAVPSEEESTAPPMNEDEFQWPARRDRNTYLWKTQAGMIPLHIPIKPPTPYTDSIFPRVILPLSFLLADMDHVYREQILGFEDPEETLLAMVPFGASTKLYEDNPSLPDEITKFLRALDFTENSEVQVVQPVNAKKREGRPAKSSVLILTGAHKTFAQTLRWIQTFPVNKTITFNVIPFVIDQESWKIGTIVGSAVKDTERARLKAIETISNSLRENQKWTQLVNGCLKSREIGENTKERINYALASIDLTYMVVKDNQGDPTPSWLMTGQPVTADKTKHAEWLNLIRTGTYIVNLWHRLSFNPLFERCELCFLDNHPTNNCPFPETQGWKGPTMADIPAKQQQAKGERGSQKRKQEKAFPKKPNTNKR